MRVLLVNKFHYHKGGAETYYFALAEGLRTAGHEVAFFSMKHPSNLPCAQEKYFVTQREYNGGTSPLKMVEDGVSLIYSREAREKFDSLLRDFQPDIIHMNNVHRQITLSILDAPYLREHRVPVVYTAHDYILVCPAYTMVDGEEKVCDRCLGGRFGSCLRHRCVKSSLAKSALATAEAEFLKHHRSYDKIDLIIAPSRFMKEKLEEGGFAGRVVYLQNFLTDSQVAMGERCFDADKLSKPPYFLYFGRLTEVKGVVTLVRAFAEACRGGLPADWSLRIAGDGPERARIEQIVADEGLQDRVELLGYLTGEPLQRQVGGARFTVMPSEWRENMPYSGLESLAAGTPVIGARIGGIPDIVSDGETGLLFEAGNVEGLADSLRKAGKQFGDAPSYSLFQCSCLKYVQKYCRQSSYVGKLEGLYEGRANG
ncbi:glycosyltransferase [Olsenella profusa]|uniref:Glycosyltransferase n=1 Tax=Olsenella profusa TaxID=138595 RepID=A0ABS2F4I2_9ACTN|nr:glycosyltransferase [Olsenella profusa]